MKHFLAFGTACAMAAGFAVDAGIGVVASPAPAAPESYATRAKDILQKNCLDCHGEKAKGGLRLDSFSGIRLGGDDGAVIVPGDPEASMLIQAVRRTGELKMPPKSTLSATEVSDLEAWVKAGAQGADPTPTPGTSPAPTTASSGASITSPSRSIPADADPDFFENKVRPILANNCYECHSDSASGGLRLDSREGLAKGGKRGIIVQPQITAEPVQIRGHRCAGLTARRLRACSRIRQCKTAGL